jgi:hypothetical protein
MNQSHELTLEQEFEMTKFASQVQELTYEQAKGLLVELNRQMMIRESLYKQIMKNCLLGSNLNDSSDPVLGAN